ncbi:hypothetical protein QO034_00125 [Sedimentitalea sp. JM2-8]|uniref:Uncharacterized protein n=1 Tax=Sedimentitalea xiamensis TaxID=3050037 RepID=A0ABT7F8R7_9RHOB|nr:hypothetical protein [Sedimentitalea xiamensis]MDK3071500.1 hypothetical protein [Sedimentitalea xiamensis]
MTLTKIRFLNGVWHGRLASGRSAGTPPEVRVRYRDGPLPGVTVSPADASGQWDIFIPVPSDAIADGVHTFVVQDAETGGKLGDFTLIAGDAAADDLRAELDLLRAELDLLKRAFRQHCRDTGAS